MDALGIVSLVGMGVTGGALLALRVRDRSPLVRAALVAALAPWNAVVFRARRRRRSRRREFTPSNESKDDLYAFLPEVPRAQAWERARELRDRYDLAPLEAASSAEDYREALYILDALEALAGCATLDPQALPDASERLRAIDVGSKDFRYAFALERWCSHVAGRPVALVGIEIDGAGVYRDGHTRADRADAYCRQVGPHVRFEVGDFLAFESEPVHVATVFFPFVLPYQLAAWGLPLAHFAPRRHFERLRGLLAPGGWLVVANHTKEEAARAIELAAQVGGLRHVRSIPMASARVTYAEETEERIAHLFVREAVPERAGR